MRILIYLTTVSVYLILFSNHIWAIDREDTYIFAASACPPWETATLEKYANKIADACKNDVEVFTSSLKKALDIPNANIVKVLNDQATYDGLKQNLKKFADSVPVHSRVVMLLNFHGALTTIGSADNKSEEEVFILWTNEKPFSELAALDTNQWITTIELRDQLDKIRAKEIVIIIDSCHSGAALHDIFYHGRDEDWDGREAVITSSKPEQYAYFTVEGSNGVFTLELSESIDSGSSDLNTAYEQTYKGTVEYLNSDYVQEKCSEMFWQLLKKKQRCVQTPVKYDPSNLLPTIKLN